MSAKQIPTKTPPPNNQSRLKLGPLTHLTRTRALPRRHLQGGARHETRRCRPILAGFWAFTREGERGWRGEDLGCTSKEEERRLWRRCRRAGQANQRFPAVLDLATEHTPAPDPARMALETGYRVQRESKRRKPDLRYGKEGELRVVANPRQRLITRVVEQAGQNHQQPAPAEKDVIASPSRAALQIQKPPPGAERQRHRRHLPGRPRDKDRRDPQVGARGERRKAVAAWGKP